MSKVSVIIPVYNVEKYIERCASSLFEQTFDDIEFVFVDDCSNDNSIKILQNTIERYKIKDKVKIIHHKNNKGVAAARNTGLLNATGDYIGWVDADDWVKSNMFGSLYSSAFETDADVSCCDIEVINSISSYRLCRFHNFDLSNKTQLLQSYVESKWTYLFNILAKRSLYIRWNLKCIDVQWNEDYYLSVMLLYYANKIIYVKDSLYCYNRTNAQSITNNTDFGIDDGGVKSFIEIINFFTSQNVIETYRKYIYWKILYLCQGTVLNVKEHKELLYNMDTFPKLREYIWSNPF